MKHFLIGWFVGTSTPNMATTFHRTMTETPFGGRPTITNRERRRDFILHATIPSFPDRFGRWRFLQDLLDGDVEDGVVNSVLYDVLDAYRKDPPATASEDGTLGSPKLTPELITKLEAVLETSEENESAIVVFSQSADDVPVLLDKLENLLPDDVDEEDAYRSGWDTVMEIHGRDMVKANEMNPTAKWRKLCLVARLLVHYDFLTRDVTSSQLPK